MILIVYYLFSFVFHGFPVLAAIAIAGITGLCGWRCYQFWLLPRMWDDYQVPACVLTVVADHQNVFPKKKQEFKISEPLDLLFISGLGCDRNQYKKLSKQVRREIRTCQIPRIGCHARCQSCSVLDQFETWAS